MIDQITSQWRTQCRSHNYSHSVNSLRHSTFGNGITFGNNGLGSHQQGATTNTLHKSKGDQFPNVCGVSAKKGTNRKKNNGGHEIIASSKLL